MASENVTFSTGCGVVFRLTVLPKAGVTAAMKGVSALSSSRLSRVSRNSPWERRKGLRRGVTPPKNFFRSDRTKDGMFTAGTSTLITLAGMDDGQASAQGVPGCLTCAEEGAIIGDHLPRQRELQERAPEKSAGSETWAIEGNGP